MRKGFLFALVFALCLGLFACGSHEDEKVSTKGFRVEFSEKGVERFLNKVCKNVYGKATVADPDTDSPGSMYGGCYVATVDVKLKGKVEEEVQIRFYNENSEDKASSLTMYCYSFDYREENIFNCEKELLIALEKTIAGKSYVDKYITTYDEMTSDMWKYPRHEISTITSYNLGDDLLVTIKADRKFSSNSTGRIEYQLTKLK